MTKDFKTKMKENQRTHEEEKQKLQKELGQNSKERRKIIEKEVSKNQIVSLLKQLVILQLSHPPPAFLSILPSLPPSINPPPTLLSLFLPPFFPLSLPHSIHPPHPFFRLKNKSSSHMKQNRRN